MPRYRNDENYFHPASPVVGVSWYEACACSYGIFTEYGPPFSMQEMPSCKSLLCEYEWSRAALWDKDKRIIYTYPWGDKLEKNNFTHHTNVKESALSQTSPVMSFPLGKSSAGCYDIVGNVFEWQCNIYGDNSSPVEMIEYDVWSENTGCKEKYISAVSGVDFNSSNLDCGSVDRYECLTVRKNNIGLRPAKVSTPNLQAQKRRGIKLK